MKAVSAGRNIEPQVDATTQRNFRFLYLEIAFAAVLSAIVTFNGAFAIRLGASEALVALLVSGPALVSALFSIPTARFLQKKTARGFWIWSSLFIVRVGYGLLAFIPWLTPSNPAAALVIWVVLLNLPAIFFTNGFQPLLAELIPERRRAQVFSRRQVIWSILVIITSALAGAWLDRMRPLFPQNYQFMYIFGFIISLGSMYFLLRIRLPERHVPTVESPASTPISKPPTLRGPLGRLLFNVMIYNFGLNLAGPLYNIHYIQTLHASDGWIGLNAAAGSAGVVCGYILWERLLRRRPFTWALRRASLLTWTFPLALALVPDLNFVLLVNFVVNMFHPGVELSILNIMLKMGEAEHRTVSMSWYNVVVNGCIFAAPLAGAAIAGPGSIPLVFVLSAVIRIIGGTLFNVNSIREPV